MTDYLENLEQQGDGFLPVEETPTVERAEEEEMLGEAEEKGKRRTRKKKIEAAEEGTLVETDSAEPEAFDTEPFEEGQRLPLEVEQEETARPEEADAPKRSRRPVTLDSYGNVIRETSDSGLRDISILTAARNARATLTATIGAL